jgi:hypothetical protein
LLAFENGPVRPGFRRIALASKGGESKLLFHQRNKEIVAARTQQQHIGKSAVVMSRLCPGDSPPIPRSDGMKKPPTINDKALAAVDSERRTAREIFAILDEGAYRSTVAAQVRLADAGKIERRHDPYRNMMIARYRRVT